jgi:hypothetical protein
MGMPFLLTQNQTGTTNPIFVDWMQSPFSLSFGAIATGGPTYNVEYTLDNIEITQIGPFSGNANATTLANATWFQSAVSGTTSSASGSIAAPVRAVRLNIVTSSATAFVVCNFIQATYPGS